MATGKLTKRAVDAVALPAKGEVMLWDGELRGFGVRVRAGGAKSFMVLYRAGAGRGAPLRKITIGAYGSPWTVETARVEAKRLLGQVAGGIDPAAVKRELRDAKTMADLADKFLTDHVDSKRKERTASEYRRILDRIIRPALGMKRIAEVTRADVAKLHHAGRATPYQANRTLAVLSKMMNLAEAWNLRPDGTNPCRHVERYGETGRERMLSGAELGRLGEALRAYKGSPYNAALVKLLLFTGARLGEMLALKWSNIDFENGVARLADSKTGAKTIHLPPPALEVLTGLPRIDGNPYVIVGLRPGAALVNAEKPWRAIRAAADLNDVRLHDLRHAFASNAAAGGDSLITIGKLLGHSQPQTTARYAHLAPDPAKAAAALVAGRLASALQR